MATEIAKAYVQIVPSMQGIKGKLTEALSGEAISAGTNSGKTMGNALAGGLRSAAGTIRGGQNGSCRFYCGCGGCGGGQ